MPIYRQTGRCSSPSLIIRNRRLYSAASQAIVGSSRNMMQAIRDRTAANAVLIVRVCCGAVAEQPSATHHSPSRWHHTGLRSIQLAARACFQHSFTSTAASAAGPASQPAPGPHAWTHPQPAPSAEAPLPSRAAPMPLRARVGLTTLSSERQFRSSPARAALAEPLRKSAVSSDRGATLAADGDANPGAAPVVRPRAPDGVPLPPWTPTDQLQKRKTLPKRMGFMLQELEKERAVQEGAAKKLPNFGPGDSLELKLSVPENRRRVAIVKGTCIARRNRGWRTSFTIRNHLGNAGGIERIFPLYSPHIQEITVLAQKKVRRAKLYFLRDKQPKEYRV